MGNLRGFSGTLLLALAAGTVLFAQPRLSTTRNQQHVNDTLGNRPLAFEPNRGQVPAEVKFVARNGSTSAFLTATGATLSLPGAQKGEKLALRLELLGANSAAETAGINPLPGQTNYFVGNDPAKWQTAVPQYSRVKFRDIYSGIDLIYYSQRRDLEYDFLVAPGADPHTIRLAVEGARRLHLEANGDVRITTAAGELRKHRPRIYQLVGGAERKVAGRFVLHRGSILSFAIGHYDRSLPLVIDPTITLEYATLLGGKGDDIAYSVATDSSGNIYTTGSTTSTDFPTTAGVIQAANATGTQQIFVAKLDSTLSTLLYSSYLGGSGSQSGQGIAVDSSGNAYIAGYTNSTNFPITPGSLQPAFGGGTCSGAPCNDAFITKLNPTGSGLVYSTYFGGNNVDQAQAMALDTNGNVYITGFTASSNLPTTPGVVQPGFGGGADAFLMKLNSQGTGMIYSTYLGGNNVDLGNGLAIDSNGNAYVVGDTFSTNFPTTPGVFQPAAKGGTCGTNPCDDAFVTKVNPLGTGLIYSTYLGGSNSDFAQAVAVDAIGDAYVIGTTSSTDFPTVAGAFQMQYGGGSSDAFVSGLDPAGRTLFASTYFGGSGTEFGESVSLGTGYVYIAVDSNSSAFPPAFRAQVVSVGRPHVDGPTNPDLVALDAKLTQLYSELLGAALSLNPSSYFSISSEITDLEKKRAIIVGTSGGAVEGMPSGGFQPQPSGKQDAFIGAFPEIPGLGSFTLTKTVIPANPLANPPPNQPDTYFVDQELTFKLTLTNTGTMPLTNIFVADVLQPHQDPGKVPPPPSRIVVDDPDPNCGPNDSLVPNVLTCVVPILPVGGTVVIQYDLRLETEEQWDNVAVAVEPGLPPQVSSVSVFAVTPATIVDVAWKIDSGANPSSAGTPQAPVGGTVVYEITVTNQGPLTVSAQLGYQQPAGLADSITPSPTGPTCSDIEGMNGCNLGTLAPGQSATVKFTATNVKTGKWTLADGNNTTVGVNAMGGAVELKYVDPPLNLQVGSGGSLFSSVSDASFTANASLAASDIVAGFGSGLSNGVESASTTPLPTKLAGTSVMVTPGSSSQPAALRGRATSAVAAPLFFVSPGQINYLIPPGTPVGPATVTIVNDTLGTVASGTLQIAAVAPGLFSANSSGQGVAVAEAVRASAGGAQTNVTVFQCGNAAGSCVPVPIDLGPSTDTVVLVLFGTGIRGFSNIKNVTAAIGTTNAPVLFAGAQGGFVGLDQVNVQIPRSLIGSGVVNVVLTVDGQPSNAVTISIK